MSNIKTLGDKAFRDYKEDGYPGSGANEPDKREVREFVDEVHRTYQSGLGGGGTSFDTLANANAAIDTIADNGGVNILDDGDNNGFYVKQDGALVKKSDATLTALDQRADNLNEQVGFATYEASDRGVAYAQDAVAGFDDQDGNLGAGLLRSGQFVGKFRGGALHPLYVDYDVSDDGAVIYAIRRSDGMGWVGLRPEADIRVYTTGAEGSRTVWAAIDGQQPWSLTSTPGDYHSPVVEGCLIKWIEIADGMAFEHTAIAVVRASPLDPSVTRIEHVLVLGQSLATGAYDAGVVHSSAVVPGFAVSFNSGARTLPNHDEAGVNTVIDADDISYFINLREVNQQVSRSLGETISSGAAARMKRTGGIASTTAVLWSIHAIGGQSIEDVWEGTVPFENSITAVTSAKAIADADGRDYACLSASFIGGESNRQNTLAQYTAKLETYQSSYKTAINGITGNSDDFIIVSCQMSNWTAFATSYATSDVPLAQLQTAIDDPDKFACVGPKYFLDTYTDGVHLTGVSEARLGAYHGRVHEAISKGQVWMPLYPTAAVRTGASVVLTFNVPSGSLVIDTTNVSDPGNYGLEWFDNGDGNTVEISDVEVTAANQVTVTLSAEPTGTGQQIGIARTGIVGNHAGPTTGPRSNLRDSSSDVDDMGYPMYNWCCHSLIDVTEAGS